MEAIASLPLVLTVVFCELAIGGAALLFFLDRTGPAPSGFRKLTAIVDVVAIAAAAALLPTLPGGDLAQRAGLQAGPLAAFAQALPLVVGFLVVHAIV